MKDKLLIIICRCMEATERIHSEFLVCDERDKELNRLANETADKILKAIEKHKCEIAAERLWISETVDLEDFD